MVPEILHGLAFSMLYNHYSVLISDNFFFFYQKYLLEREFLIVPWTFVVFYASVSFSMLVLLPWNSPTSFEQLGKILCIL